MSTAEAPLSLGSCQIYFDGGEGEVFDGLPSLGAGFPCGDGLPRSPTRHNGVLSLQDGLLAHLDLNCNPLLSGPGYSFL